MNRLALVITFVVLAGCNDDSIEHPTLCVFVPDKGASPEAEANCPASPRTFAKDQAFYIKHSLPDRADIKDPVSITVETACPNSAVTTKHFHDEHVALIPAVAPAGAECSLIVTATILNETARYISLPQSGECFAKCDNPGGGGEGGSN